MQTQDTRHDPFPSRGYDDYFFTTPALRDALEAQARENIRGELELLR